MCVYLTPTGLFGSTTAATVPEKTLCYFFPRWSQLNWKKAEAGGD